MNPILQTWNQLDDNTAAAAILPCCGSLAWASRVANSRPLDSEETLFKTSDEIWLQLAPTDWNEAFASHPRIGERKIPASATAASADWSRQEQQGVAESEADIQGHLRLENAVYEKRFGRTYIVCATGKSAEQMLAILKKRLANDHEQELREAVEQQRQITQLRLRKWLQR